MEYAQKLFLSQVFSQMRLVVRNEKRMRIRTLNVFCKAWKDYIFFNRHLMLVNTAAINFCKVKQYTLLKNCFNQLLKNREDRKYELIKQSLNDEVDVAIANFTKFNHEKQSKMLTDS